MAGLINKHDNNNTKVHLKPASSSLVILSLSDRWKILSVYVRAVNVPRTESFNHGMNRRRRSLPLEAQLCSAKASRRLSWVVGLSLSEWGCVVEAVGWLLLLKP